jgi:hypothetical protein
VEGYAKPSAELEINVDVKYVGKGNCREFGMGIA